MRETIKSEIKSLLTNKDNPVCVLLKGEWGVGKTHLWKEIEKELKEKNNEKTLIAYVSLFGKENITQIEQEVKSQISIMPEIKEKFKKTKDVVDKIPLESIPIIGNLVPVFTTSLNGLLSILGNEIKNVIICFDDFERHSKNLEFKDILGEISILKENNNCNILMIMNEDDLKNKKEDKEIFDKYKEKIVDFEFAYEPTPQDSLEIIKNDFDTFKDFALEYFEANLKCLNITINNIRIMKKIANSVKHLSSHIKNFESLDKNMQNDFFAIIADAVIIHTKQSEKDEIFSQYFSPDFEKYVQSKYLNNNIPNDKLLEKETKNAIENYQSIQTDKQLEEFQNNFYEFYRKFTMLYDYDFKKSNEEYAKKILMFLEDDKFTNVVKDYSVAKFLITKLDELNNDKENNHNLGLKLMKKYIEIYKFDKDILDDIINFDKEKLEDFYDDFMKENNISDELNLNSPEEIIQYLSFNNYDNWGNLKFIKNEKLKEYFLNNAVFAEKCIKLSQSDRYENLNEFRNKIVKVLEDITNDEKNDKFIQDKCRKHLDEIKKRNKSQS